MKCPRCGSVLEEGDVFCGYCAYKLEQTPMFNEAALNDSVSYEPELYAPVNSFAPYASPSSSSSPESELFRIIKNKIEWRVPENVVASRMDEEMFSNMDQASGVILQKGITGVIIVDGKEVMQLSGGVYDFVDPYQVDEMMNRRVVSWGSLRGAALKMWRGAARFLMGKQVKDQVDAFPDQGFESMDNLIQWFNRQANISLYLKRDHEFWVGYDSARLLGVDGRPTRLATRYLDVELGVRFLVRICDFQAFIRYFLVASDRVTLNDLAQCLAYEVTGCLQQWLQDAEVCDGQLTCEQKRGIAENLMKLNRSFPGLEILRVGEIACTSSELERFRQVEREIYLSERELDYLKRTNDFKNRLAGVTNEQQVREARTDFELQQVLDQLNRDQLLHEDEEENFRILLSRQKRIAEARNVAEIEKAMFEIEATRLLSEDEFEALKLKLQDLQFDRKNISEIMRLQSIALQDRKRLEAMEDLKAFALKKEDETHEVAAEIRKKELQRSIDNLELEDAVYARQAAFQQHRQDEELSLESVLHDHQRGEQLKDAAHQGDLVRESLKTDEAVTDAKLEKAKKIADTEFYVQRRKEDFEEEKRERAWKRTKEEQDQHLEYVRKNQEISMSNLKRIQEMNEQSAQNAHLRDMDKEAWALRHKQEENRVEIHRIDADTAIRGKELDVEAGYSAEQLFAKKLDRMGDGGQAAAIYAQSFSSKKELEAERAAQEKIDRERAKHDEEQQLLKEEYRRMADAKNQMVNEMMDRNTELMKSMMDTMVRSNSAQASANQNMMDRMERMGSARMSDYLEQGQRREQELARQKEEYREQMRHEQERHDLHQDRALNYTTQAGRPMDYGRPNQPQPAGYPNNPQMVVCPHCQAVVKKLKYCMKCGTEL